MIDKIYTVKILQNNEDEINLNFQQEKQFKIKFAC